MSQLIYDITSHSHYVKGNIADVMKEYRRHHIPMRQLLSDYAAAYLPDNTDIPAVCPWIAYNKKHGLEYEAGVSIHETCFNYCATKLRKENPSDIIRALFYTSANNESAVQCDFIFHLIKKTRKGNLGIVFFPSPDFIYQDFEANPETIYAVPDETVALLYNKEFKTDRFCRFESFPELLNYKYSIIFPLPTLLQKDADYRKTLHFMRRMPQSSTIFAFLPNVLYENNRQDFNNPYLFGHNLNAVFTVPGSILVSPKKKSLFVFSDKSGPISLYRTTYFKETKKLEITDQWEYERSVVTHGTASMLQLLNEKPFDYAPDAIRSSAQLYNYSDEIKIYYTVKKDNCGTDKISAAVYSLLKPDEKRRKRGSRITDYAVRRLGKQSIDNIIEDMAVNDDWIRSISNYLHAEYDENPTALSFKSAWYLVRSSLLSTSVYDDNIAKKLFYGNNPLARIRPEAATEDDIIKAAEESLQLARDDIEYACWLQLDIILRRMLRSGLAASNPLSHYVESRSRALTESQREVRNALAKRSFESMEIDKIMSYLCQTDSSGTRRYASSPEYFGLTVKLMTGISTAELLTLNWGDISPTGLIEGRSILITRRMKDKRPVSYTAKERYRIRSIPVPAELEFILNSYFQNIKTQTGLSDDELGARPILMTHENKVLSEAALRRAAKRLWAAADIESDIIAMHEDTDITETDLNSLNGDFLRSNARYYFRQVCCMREGESCYLLGIEGPTTFDRNYVDYSDELLQYRLACLMRRWLSRYDNVIGMPTTTDCTPGIRPMEPEDSIVSGIGHAVSTALCFPNGCQSGSRIEISAVNGLRWSVNAIYKEKK